MNLKKIQNIEKLLFNANDISNILSISKKSAHVTASRYVDAGLLIRLKRDLFVLPQRFQNINEEESFIISNFLQTPSYISLTTALSYYNLTTQQTQCFIEAVGRKRTALFEVKDYRFNYSLVKEEFYFGFERKENFFIATPAKALADSIYLTSLGKYNADFDAIDFGNFNKSDIEEILNKTNKTAINLWRTLKKNYKF